MIHGLPPDGVKPSQTPPPGPRGALRLILAGITVSPSLKWTPSISTSEKSFSVDSCLISAFMLWPMCLAQTTWKPRGWLHGGGTKVHLSWTLWPASSGVITGRDGRDGTAAGDKVKTVRLGLSCVVAFGCWSRSLR